MARDNYQHVTDKLIALLESGVIPWHRPWSMRASDAPRSVHGHFYRGFNAFILGTQGYSDPRWITFKQAREQGGSVTKGQKGTTVVLWKWFDETDKNSGKPTGKRIPWINTFTVFNVEQCKDLELPAIVKPDANDWDPIEEADRILGEWLDCPPIHHTRQGRACYSPARDAVTMPLRESFHTAAGYYSVLFHELTHATGHEKRLNRDLGHGFGSDPYAKEELVAELGASFMRAECGIDHTPTLENSAAYIQSWIRRFKDDKRMLITAAQQAQKAADMITRRTVESAKDEGAQVTNRAA